MQNKFLKSCQLFFILTALMGLTGCFGAKLSAFDGPERTFSLKHEPMFYTVQFAGNGKAELSAEEQKAIQSFTNHFEPAQGEQLSVSFQAGLDSDAANAAATQSQAVIKYLRSLGLNPGISGALPHTGENQVAIIRMSPKLVLPECPDWKEPDGNSFSNTVYGNYNCANMYNLGAMIANPMDLVAPAGMSPADGQGSVLSIQRYRADKVRELIEETPTTLNQ